MSLHVAKINAFIPAAVAQTNVLVHTLTADQLRDRGGYNKVWSVLFHRFMNRLTVAAGLRKVDVVELKDLLTMGEVIA